MGSRQPDDTPDGVLVLDVAPATLSSSALSDDAPDLPDNLTLFTGQTTLIGDSHMVTGSDIITFLWQTSRAR